MGQLVVKFAPMHPDFLAQLDTHWAARLCCDPALLRNQNTNIIPAPHQPGAEVWLFDKTCVMRAAPLVAQALKSSVGMRSPLVAFEPSRLKDTLSRFGLEFHGPEAILARANCEVNLNTIHWISARETEAELAAVVQAAGAGLLLAAIPLNQRAARRAAEACGFELYASAIYLGERPVLF